MINLFTTYYHEANESRRAELDFCLSLNLFFDRTVILAEGDFPHLKHEKRLIVNSGARPTFSDFLRMMALYPDDLNILCNTDIFFNRKNIEEYCNDMPESHCYALSRADINSFGDYELFDRPDSQDAWIFKGAPKPIHADFCLGIPGCDNRFAYELQQAGYTVLNRSRSIHAYHVHASNVRNYIKQDGTVSETVPPPYLLLNPIS